MIMSGVALLADHPQPTRDDIVEHMDGNICRCGTYARIIEAIQRAAELQKGGAK
jgi:isoquinoline 1-oxidoreductase alpha subunit